MFKLIGNSNNNSQDIDQIDEFELEISGSR